jgi:hypothetical protein
MLRRIYRFSPLGTILGIANLAISVLWIAIAYDNPWHQLVLAYLDFPASYIAIGFDHVLDFVLPRQYTLQAVASDSVFVVVGIVWFFAMGTLIQRGIIALLKAVTRRSRRSKPEEENIA